MWSAVITVASQLLKVMDSTHNAAVWVSYVVKSHTFVTELCKMGWVVFHDASRKLHSGCPRPSCAFTVQHRKQRWGKQLLKDDLLVKSEENSVCKAMVCANVCLRFDLSGKWRCWISAEYFGISVASWHQRWGAMTTVEGQLCSTHGLRTPSPYCSLAIACLHTQPRFTHWAPIQLTPKQKQHRQEMK